jgi:pimeloyl-ACP methyl ester carboxylesterase
MLEFERGGEGTPIVLVHGITESRRSWDPLLERLAGSHDVLAVDLRGHGESEASEPYDVITLASDVHEVVEALGIENPLLIGHSLGGTVVSAYAAMYPCCGVANIDQPMRLGDFQATLQSIESMLRGDDDAFQQVMKMVFEEMRGQVDDEEWERLASLRRADQEVVLAIWAAVLDAEAEDLEAMVDSLASAITVPYLSLHGTDPGEGYEQWLCDLIDDARVEQWEGLGHYPHLVDPDRFFDLLEDFEESLAEGRSE